MLGKVTCSEASYLLAYSAVNIRPIESSDLGR
jgi:hypothetical protein